jgi:hypothetical protein
MCLSCPAVRKDVMSAVPNTVQRALQGPDALPCALEVLLLLFLEGQHGLLEEGQLEQTLDFTIRAEAAGALASLVKGHKVGETMCSKGLCTAEGPLDFVVALAGAGGGAAAAQGRRDGGTAALRGLRRLSTAAGAELPPGGSAGGCGGSEGAGETRTCTGLRVAGTSRLGLTRTHRLSQIARMGLFQGILRLVMSPQSSVVIHACQAIELCAWGCLEGQNLVHDDYLR